MDPLHKIIFVILFFLIWLKYLDTQTPAGDVIEKPKRKSTGKNEKKNKSHAKVQQMPKNSKKVVKPP